MDTDALLSRLEARPAVQISEIHRRGLGFVVRMAEELGPVTVTRYGNSVVVIVSTADMELLRQIAALKSETLRPS